MHYDKHRDGKLGKLDETDSEIIRVKNAILGAATSGRPKANIAIVNDIDQAEAGGWTLRADDFSFIKAKGMTAINPIFIELTSAHELGHQLSLSQTDKTEYHDKGPFPIDKDKTQWFGLMETGDRNGVSTEWLRRIDWKTANEQADKKSKQP